MKTCTKFRFFWVLLLISSTIQAQIDVSIRKNEFKNGKDGLKEAWKHIEDGDTYYSRKGVWYNNAYAEYLKAYAYNNKNAELNYKTGASALFSDSKQDAAGFLLKALEQKNDVANDILLMTGRALQYSGNYSDALAKLEEYINSKGKKSKENIALAEKWTFECRNALEVTKDTLEIEIKNLGSAVNTTADEYSQVLSPDGKSIYFASRRELKKSSDYYKDSKYDENIFLSVSDSGSWQPAIPAGKNITTKYCEAPVAINPEGKRLYIYAGYENGGDILMTEVNKKGQWKMPERIPFRINSKDAETSIAVSPAGNEIFFVKSGDKKGEGGKDIYFIKKVNERKWSKPVNAGKVINTKYNEEAVRLSKTGDTLWFSSTGHNSIGGYDIFYSVRNRSTGEWDSVKNCGYPVNTPWDDMFYQQSPGEDSAFYFVSNRSGGLGGFDIYKGIILPPPPKALVVEPAPAPAPAQVPEMPVKPDTVVIRDTVVVIKENPVPAQVVQPAPPEVILYLTGTVKDSETGMPVIARVDLIDPASDIPVATTASSDVDGSYRIRIPSKKSYMAEFRGNGFLADMKRIDIDPASARDFYNLDVKMVKVKVGKKVVLKNILFESGKSVLTAGSYKELESLGETLRDNAGMKIEISGHTDKTGSEPINLKLSEERSKAVVEYLVQKGIDRQRLTYKGYGSSQPVDVNTTPAGRAKNRRVEFKILEF
jgi:outer membrane protein OmpA-like peptidoglycan-associated protein/tetratricopeptide (TPR) repeat protein